MRIFIFLSLSLLVGCVEHPAIHTTKGKSHIQFAEYFDIKTNNRDTILIIKDPDNGVEEQYLLTRSDSKKKNGLHTIQINDPRIVATSSTFIGMMSKLDIEDHINGVLNKAYVHNDKILNGINSGIVFELGSLENIPLEKVVEMNSTLILYSGFGTTLNNEEQLEKLGVECLPVYDWKEKDPLGKAEWILLYGFLSGKEEQAANYIKDLAIRYNALLKKDWKAYPTILAGNVYGDVWNTPTGQSYVARMMKDAGGKYLFEQSTGTGSLLLSIEEVVLRSDSAQIWINPGYPSMSELLNVNPKAKHIKAFQQGNVFCYSHDMNRFWELSAIEPDKMLQDQVKIFHGGNMDSLYFYRRIINDLE